LIFRWEKEDVIFSRPILSQRVLVEEFVEEEL